MGDGEKRRDFTRPPCRVSHCHNTDVWTSLKLIMMIVHIKRYKYPILTYDQLLLSGQLPHRSNSSHLFLHLKVQCSVGGKYLTTYYWLAFSINWFQCSVFAFTYSSTTAISTCTSESSLLPMTMMLSWTDNFHLALI